MSFDTEIHEYITSFSRSTQRVRWVMVVLAVTCLLIFSGYRNSRSNSWMNSRLDVAKTALAIKAWSLMESPADPGHEAARQWAKFRGCQDETDVRRWISELEKLQLNNVLKLEVPFLGLVLDLNDLGILGGLALSVLMILLALCMSRQNENLYLGLWKVKRIADREHLRQGSQANVLYHAMAMAEVFNKPPTLARWKTPRIRKIYRLVFIFPLAIQFLIFRYDMESMPIAHMFNKDQAVLGTWAHVVSLLVIGACTLLCFLYSRASDRRWDRTFFDINPRFKYLEQPPLRDWLQLRWYQVGIILVVAAFFVILVIQKALHAHSWL